nr:CRISPR-associated endoribonuclease Cas6 [uncultured Carboxylicivirga sp.]
MRVHFKLKSLNKTVPFNHQHLLTGAIHKWLGWNNQHGEISLYSFSRLEGGSKFRDGLSFSNGSSFFFSAHDPNLIKQLINGIQKDPTMFSGLTVAEIIIQQDPNLSTKEQFFAASPIFIKRRNGNSVDHYDYKADKANQYLKETLQSKMKEAGLIDETMDISFDNKYLKAKTTTVHYKSVKNKANVCPVIINAKPETKLFAWNVGLGNSTGIGFGAIK